MSKLQYYLNLQLFADGGGGASAGGDSGATAATGGETSSITNGMPDKAKKIFDGIMAKRGKADTPAEPSVPQPPTEEEAPATQPEQKKPTYREMIESEDYKAEHERHFQRALKDRTRRYEKEAERTNGLLAIMGSKYGLDPTSETFRDDLEKAINADDSIYEKYAEEHDMPVAEARKMVGLQQQIARTEQQAAERKAAEAAEEAINALKASGEATKKIYPNFDLDTEMQDPKFVRLTAALGGDTTLAYQAMHHNDIVYQTAQKAAETARQNVAESVRTNQHRPSEAGISSSHSTNTKPDFKSMDRKAFNAYVAELRKRS